MTSICIGVTLSPILYKWISECSVPRKLQIINLSNCGEHNPQLITKSGAFSICRPPTKHHIPSRSPHCHPPDAFCGCLIVASHRTHHPLSQLIILGNPNNALSTYYLARRTLAMESTFRIGIQSDHRATMLLLSRHFWIRVGVDNYYWIGKYNNLN